MMDSLISLISLPNCDDKIGMLMIRFQGVQLPSGCCCHCFLQVGIVIRMHVPKPPSPAWPFGNPRKKRRRFGPEDGDPNRSRRGDSWHLDIIWHHEFFQVCSTLNMFCCCCGKTKVGPFHGYIQRSFLGILFFFHWSVMFEGRVHCSRKSSISTNH